MSPSFSLFSRTHTLSFLPASMHAHTHFFSHTHALSLLTMLSFKDDLSPSETKIRHQRQKLFPIFFWSNERAAMPRTVIYLQPSNISHYILCPDVVSAVLDLLFLKIWSLGSSAWAGKNNRSHFGWFFHSSCSTWRLRWACHAVAVAMLKFCHQSEKK